MKSFLEEFYASSGSTFNVKSGRADRMGNKDAEIYGYRKCIMQVHKPNTENPRMKGLNQNCPAELNSSGPQAKLLRVAQFFLKVQKFMLVVAYH